jgi:hypothetical protein
MRIAALRGSALLFAALAVVLVVRASGTLSTIVDPLPAVLLAAASFCAVAIHARSFQVHRRVLLASVFAAGFVALLGAGFLGLHVWLLFSDRVPGLRTLLLGASYLLGGTLVLVSLRVRASLVTRPWA